MPDSPTFSTVPDSRVRVYGERAVNADAPYVLYWMVANRRATWNYSLDRALDWCESLGKPLVVLEALRCDYRWASDRLHRFVIEGMRDNAAAFEKHPAAYYPYIEPEPNAGAGLLKELAANAAVVVSDDYPCFFLPAVQRAARRQLGVRFELVDSNGILPMRATDRVFSRAYDFRRHLQKTITLHLAEAPAAEPFSDRDLPDTADLPAEVTRRWPRADFATAPDQLSDLPIDHSVGPAKLTGGSLAAAERADAFFAQLIGDYDDQRNQPEADASSGLSPYLHFGHISSHETFARACDRDGWSPDKVSDKADGSSSGWWGGGENFEAFMDELITWRELGFNRCALTTDFDRYESLPDWAQKTLAEHEGDTREHVYELDQFERADTHDELWNAAQQQLLQEGKIHNYLRMLWGKKILEWSATPRDALAVMLELNNKYAVDGRDPNSYSGIFWVLGRYDRAWGPERPIFGKIRYMSSKNTAKKVRVKDYVSHYLHGEQTLFS